MSQRLLPCPACARHVRIIESFCPFCGNTLPLSLRSAAPARMPARRLGRAAIAAFGAAALINGCGGDDATTDASTDSSVTVDSSVDSSTGDSSTGDSSTADSAMPDAMPDTSIAPAYGAPVDAGPPDAMDDGAVMNLYGAPPEP
jgi:hypothetical protein